MSDPILEQLDDWTPEARAKVVQRLRTESRSDNRIWYCRRGRSCDGKPHEGVDYPHARSDQWPPGGHDWLTWATVGGRGCVAPWTRIYLPESGRHVRVDELTEDAFTVGTPQGHHSTDGPAFLKGFAHMWTVCLSDGNAITVTDQHRFLSPQGWIRLSDVHAGQPLCASPHSAQPSYSGLRPASPSGVRRSGGIVSSSLSGCRAGRRSRDRYVHVVSVTYSHYGSFYDLTVPGPSAYYAEGLVNHNSGKTRSGAEYTRYMSERTDRIGLIAPTGPAARDVMVEGDSGLIRVCEAAGKPCEYFPSRRKIVFSSGAVANLFSAEEPDRLRGPQHGHVWCDEPAHFAHVQEVWDMMLLGLRLGASPHVAITTTPLPTKWMRSLLESVDTVAVRASTYANIDNLAPSFAKTVLERYEGTRLGRQELYGEILQDVEGALWDADMFHASGLDAGDMDRIVVAIDPAGTNNRRSDETGIVAVGLKGYGRDAAAHVLADRSGKYSPAGWASAADSLYRHLSADAIVVEKNFGGDMVKSNLVNYGVKARIIMKTASRSKQVRAEPAVGLYEQGRVLHAPGLLALEDEMLTWVPGVSDSPNRVDALVWALDELIDSRGPVTVSSRATNNSRIARNREPSSIVSRLTRLRR